MRYIKYISRIILLVGLCFLFIPHANAAFVVTKSKVNVSSGLAGWWTFDGKYLTSATATDRSGNSRDGTLVGLSISTSTIPGKMGQALIFNGTTQYINLATGKLFFTESSPFSGTAWIRTSSSTHQPIMSNHNNGGNPGWSFAVGKTIAGRLSIGVLRATQTQGRQISSTARVDDGRWHHVAFTYDGSQTVAGLTLYIDGVLAPSAQDFSQTITAFSDGFGAIGSRRGTTPVYFRGSIDDVRTYNRVLSAAEIRKIYLDSFGKMDVISNPVLAVSSNIGSLVGWWTLDGTDLATATATDRSGDGNNGTLGFISKATGTTIGKIGQGINFNGTSHYIRIASSTTLARTTSHTLSAWVKPASTAGTSSVVMKNSLGTGMFLYGLSGKWSTYVITASGKFIAQESTGSMATSSWVHLMSVYDSSANLLSLYKNNSLIATTSVTGSSLVTTAGSSSIGYDPRSGGVDYFKGVIDDVRIYSKALNATERQTLYKLGQSKLGM